VIPFRRFGLLGPIAFVGLIAAACGGFANPEGWASPTIDDQVAYVFGGDDVAAVQIDTGQRQWVFPDEADPEQKDIDVDAVYADPLVTDDAVYIASFDDGIYALNRDSGSVRWRFSDFGGEVIGTPALAGDRVVFGTSQGRLYALGTDGRPAPGWPEKGVDDGEPVWAGVVTDGERIYAATMRGDVMAYSPENGDELWDEPFDIDGAIASLALTPNGRLFVPGFNRHVYLLDVTTGEPVNPDGFRTHGWVWQPPAFSDDRAFFGDLEGYVYALDLETGDPAWEKPYKVSAKVKAAPVLVGDTLVVVDRKPAVTLINAADGTPRGAYPLSVDGTVRADLVAADGMAYFVTTKGDLWRIDPATGERVEITREGSS
jgi:outer membrane protein assembly factor BamB